MFLTNTDMKAGWAAVRITPTQRSTNRSWDSVTSRESGPDPPLRGSQSTKKGDQLGNCYERLPAPRMQEISFPCEPDRTLLAGPRAGAGKQHRPGSGEVGLLSVTPGLGASAANSPGAWPCGRAVPADWVRVPGGVWLPPGLSGPPPPQTLGAGGLLCGRAARGGARGGAAPPLAHWLGRVTWPWPKPRGLPAGPPSPHSHLGLRPAWGRGSRPRRCPLWRGMVLAEGLACAVWEAEGPLGFSTPPSVAAPSSDHPRGLHTMPRPWGSGYVARSRRLKTLDWWRGEGALVVSRRKEQQDGNSFPSQGR